MATAKQLDELFYKYGVSSIELTPDGDFVMVPL